MPAALRANFFAVQCIVRMSDAEHDDLFDEDDNGSEGENTDLLFSPEVKKKGAFSTVNYKERFVYLKLKLCTVNDMLVGYL